MRVAATEELVEARLALGRHADVLAELESLIADQPYRERLRAQLMLALYRCDRQADALHAYQEARRKLVEELGIEPGERLRELQRDRARVQYVSGAGPPETACAVLASTRRARRPTLLVLDDVDHADDALR